MEFDMKAHIRRQAKAHEVLDRYALKGQIVFTGSSLMEQFPITEMAQTLPHRPIVYNRGIGGDTIDGLEERLSGAVLDLEPRKLFINIGTNDISSPDYEREAMLKKYRALLGRITSALPETEIIIMSYYPVNRTSLFNTEWFGARTNEELDIVNKRLEEMAKDIGAKFVNVSDCLKDENGDLKAEYTFDGMHMYANGYIKVFKTIEGLIV